MEQTRRRIVKKKKKRWRKVLLFFMVIILAIAGYGAYVVYEATKAANDSYVQLSRGEKSKLRNKAVQFGKEPVSILLLGVEDYASGGKGGRTDSIMVATFNPESKSMKLMSIPRDTRVYIPSKDKKAKINSAYNNGKESTIETVEDFLDIPIDFYATVNFEGFKEIIDEIGGVTVDVPFDFWEYTDTFPRKKLYYKEGKQKLNGEEALGYTRMRKRDPNGDFGRADRQKEVVKAAFDALITPKNLLKVDDIAKHVGDNVETNLKVTDLLAFTTKFKGFTSQDIKTLTLEGEGDSSLGTWYFMPDQDALEKTKKELQDHLNYKAK
ncbi:LCP family protein [Bacillus massiliigorillae]|uniref:LCP family protein n=1 Tax=Bacillus massiliigorillae TaxID=1243664 RepID=UPI0003A6FC90|nr:LCP family protein [Bacillus massiliigorillae]